MKKKKDKPYELYAPTLGRRVWKVWLYNIFWSVILFVIWGKFFNLDSVAYELDSYFFLGVETFLRPQFYLTVLLSFFALRQVFKDINLIKFTYLTAKHDEDVVKVGGSKRLYEGVEGVGKTLNTANEILFIACAKERAMRLRYYLAHPFAEELSNDIDFKALKESFEYFERNNTNIPHLMSNFKLIYQGRQNYPFSMEYLDQTKRLAESFACGLTELGEVLPNSWSRIPKKAEDDDFNMRVKSESLSLSRQYWDLTMVGDEQRTGEVVLAFRSVTSSNRLLTDRRKVLHPKFLEFLQKRVENRVLKKREKTSKFLSKLYRKLGNLIQDIGFYIFTYKDKEAIKDNVKEEDLKFVISCDVPFEFDTRGKRHEYRLYGASPDASGE